MVNHTCKICQKVFKQKGHLIDHMNKKIPCQPIQNTQHQIAPKSRQKLEKIGNFFENKNIFNIKKSISDEDNINQKGKDEKSDHNDPDKSIICNYCGQSFTRKTSLNKHHKNNSCKVKKELEFEKEKMFKLLLEEKNDEIKEHKELISKLEIMIKDQNEKINELIKRIKPTKITNNTTMNNIIIKPNINKFGEENIEKLLDKKQFENKVLTLTGSNAFEACAGMIYNNPKYPENHPRFINFLNNQKVNKYEY